MGLRGDFNAEVAEDTEKRDQGAAVKRIRKLNIN